MRRKKTLIAVALAAVVSAAFSLFAVRRSEEADALVEGAKQRLGASLAEAPELDRLQASTAASMLERARGLGRTDRELEGLERYAAALTELARGDLIRAEGELSGARARLGRTPDIRVLAAEIARRRADVATARLEVEAALEEAPDDARALLLHADLALDRDDPREALDDLTRLVAIEPNAAVVRSRLALALEGAGRTEEAETALRAAIRLDADSPDAWINLGRVLRVEGRHAEARDAFDRALELSAGDADALLGRGLARAAVGDVAGGESDFRRAAELAPNDGEALLALGDLKRDLGALDEALAAYREALARAPEDSAAWLKLGNALVLGSQPVLAARAFRAALERSPDLAAAHNGLGAALMRTGDTDGAALALSRAAELDEHDANPLLNLAVLRQRAGDAEGARRAYTRALERDPDLPPTLHALLD